MSKGNITKTERLLREMRRVVEEREYGMAHKEIIQFILDMRDGIGNTEYDYNYHGDLWNAQLYGTRDRTGVLENFCTQSVTGRYKVTRNIRGPFTTKRSDTDSRFY